jgi:hypothetical protein
MRSLQDEQTAPFSGGRHGSLKSITRLGDRFISPSVTCACSSGLRVAGGRVGGTASWSCWACAGRLQARWEAIASFGLATLQAVGRLTYLWTFTPTGLDAPAAFGLDRNRAARLKALRKVRSSLGEYMWFVQGPEVVRRGQPERLGLHLLSSGDLAPELIGSSEDGMRASALVSVLAADAGYGTNVDLRLIDTQPNSTRDVAAYVARFLRRDGYRISEHGRAQVAYCSNGWPGFGRRVRGE